MAVKNGNLGGYSQGGDGSIDGRLCGGDPVMGGASGSGRVGGAGGGGTSSGGASGSAGTGGPNADGLSKRVVDSGASGGMADPVNHSSRGGASGSGSMAGSGGGGTPQGGASGSGERDVVSIDSDPSGSDATSDSPETSGPDIAAEGGASANAAVRGDTAGRLKHNELGGDTTADPREPRSSRD